ncbi:unnamed protein product [Ixodes pacificus]
MVILKSPRRRTRPSCFTTGTTGAAHCDVLTGRKIPSRCMRCSSSTTLSRSANGTGLALKNLGFDPSFRTIFADTPSNVPSVSAKTSLNCSTKLVTELTAFTPSGFEMVILNASIQYLPRSVGHVPFTTNNGSVGSRVPTLTAAVIFPRIAESSPE